MPGYYPVISGLALAPAFPKFDLWWIAWIALVPFFLALNKAQGAREAARAGLFFSLPFFGLTLWWLTSLTRFVGLWAYLAWFCLVIFQSLFVVIFAYLNFRLCKLHSLWKLEVRGWSLLQALLWVSVVEWLRAWGPFGVTAGGLGYSQVELTPLLQIASFTQVYGVSFLVVFFNAALAELIAVRKRWQPLLLSVALVLIALVYGYFSLVPSPSAPSPLVTKIALVQPNIDQFDRMNQNLVNRNFELQAELTRQAARSTPEVIVWPETALFAYILKDPLLFQRFRELARETNAWLVVGTPHYGDDGLIYNSIFALSPSGEVTSRYDKERLVPFGEYLPFRTLLLPVLNRTGYFSQDFSISRVKQPLVVAGQQVAAGVCFESTFPDAMKKRVKSDSAYMLIVTNDAWFGDSAAPYLHLNCGILRAVENRKWLVQCGNSGISAFIDPWGRVVRRTKVNERTILRLE
ncbi:MAG: apolipoprotein N-acyltransferase [Candidatus Margulisbacteria bacterium]|jgi:apolipoprotein N-acyltransferase|nr:apolipoprotein N-acyltransferase [Candidatus Margulisiibacteriota bacterium]